METFLDIAVLCWGFVGGSESEVVSKLRATEIDPSVLSERDEEGETLLHAAARVGRSPEFCRVLHELDATLVKTRDNSGCLPMHHTCMMQWYVNVENAFETAKYLFNVYPESIHISNNSGQYPIHLLAGNYGKSNDQTLQLLVFLLKHDKGAVSTPDNNSCLPLDLAIYRRELAFVKLLFDAHPDGVFVHDDEGGDGDTPTPVDIARDYNRVDLVDFFETQIALRRQAEEDRNPDINGQLPLHRVLQSENVSLGAIKLMVGVHRASVAVADNRGCIPLHYACRFGDLNIIKYLVGLHEESSALSPHTIAAIPTFKKTMHGFNDQRRKPFEPRYGRRTQKIPPSKRLQPDIRTMPHRTNETGKTLNPGRISPTHSPYNSISSRSQRARSLTTSAISFGSHSSTPPPSQIRTFNMNIGSRHSKDGNNSNLQYSPSLLGVSPIPIGPTAPRSSHHEARPLSVRSRIQSQSLRCPGENNNSKVASREISSSSQWISHHQQSQDNQKENESMLGNSSSGRGYTLESRPVASERERRSRQSTFTSSDSMTSSGTVGLSNLGNTCFMNAALQCIVHTPSLAQYFFRNSYRDANSNDDRLASSFATVLKQIYQGNNFSSFQPRTFLEDLIQIAPQFDGGRQHDCHEFIRVLIDQLSEDLCTSRTDRNSPRQNIDLEKLPFLLAANHPWKQHLSMNSSFITDQFCGQLVSTLECSVCHSQRFTFDPFYDLSLPFPEAKPGTEHRWPRRASRKHADQLSACTLDDCLNAFTEHELLTDDNMTECAYCKQKQESTKRLQVYRFPRILVLHLKRFGNDRKKIRTRVDFPIDGFDANTLAINNEDLPTNTPVYDLFAICEHSGRLNYGHYTAMCLDPTSRKWYKFDDDCVSQCCPKKIDKSAAYVLFYKQRTS